MPVLGQDLLDTPPPSCNAGCWPHQVRVVGDARHHNFRQHALYPGNHIEHLQHEGDLRKSGALEAPSAGGVLLPRAVDEYPEVRASAAPCGTR